MLRVRVFRMSQKTQEEIDDDHSISSLGLLVACFYSNLK
jgi:hypothetical protein